MALERRAYTAPLERSRLIFKYCVDAPTSRRVAVVSAEGTGVRPAGAATGADLGGSSNYSSENLED